MEHLTCMFYVYILNDKDFIQLFVTYPYLLKTKHFNKLVNSAFFTQLSSILRNGYRMALDGHMIPYFMPNEIWYAVVFHICDLVIMLSGHL